MFSFWSSEVRNEDTDLGALGTAAAAEITAATAEISLRRNSARTKFWESEGQGIGKGCKIFQKAAICWHPTDMIILYTVPNLNTHLNIHIHCKLLEGRMIIAANTNI